MPSRKSKKRQPEISEKMGSAPYVFTLNHHGSKTRLARSYFGRKITKFSISYAPGAPGEVGEWMFIVTEGTVKIVDQPLDIPWPISTGRGSFRHFGNWENFPESMAGDLLLLITWLMNNPRAQGPRLGRIWPPALRPGLATPKSRSPVLCWEALECHSAQEPAAPWYRRTGDG